jgi:hypothetical protein
VVPQLNMDFDIIISDEYDGVNQEMHSYFCQSSVNRKDIIKLPGVWDPFVLSYINVSASLCLVGIQQEETFQQNGKWYYLNFTLIFILCFKVVYYDLPY